MLLQYGLRKKGLVVVVALAGWQVHPGTDMLCLFTREPTTARWNVVVLVEIEAKIGMKVG